MSSNNNGQASSRASQQGENGIQPPITQELNQTEQRGQPFQEKPQKVIKKEDVKSKSPLKRSLSPCLHWRIIDDYGRTIVQSKKYEPEIEIKPKQKKPKIF